MLSDYLGVPYSSLMITLLAHALNDRMLGFSEYILHPSANGLGHSARSQLPDSLCKLLKIGDRLDIVIRRPLVISVDSLRDEF